MLKVKEMEKVRQVRLSNEQLFWLNLGKKAERRDDLINRLYDLANF
jgi:hypothetical protein